MAYDNSAALYQRALQSLAGGVSSHFRALASPHPLFFTHGAGSKLYDVDGREYLDYVLGQGPDILGHAPAELVSAVSAAIATGQIFAGQTETEVEVAETVCRLVPGADLVRFGSSGSEMDQAALRVARGVTGRQQVIRFEGHYHGWFDNVAYSISPPLGAAGPRDHPIPIPWTQGQAASTRDDLIVLPWNDLGAVDAAVARHKGEVAAILTEPIMCNTNCIEPGDGFLAGLRAICDRERICLIFDEVITGFRVAPGGAQQKYGVTPDLSVFGKACAAGYPLAILAGTRAWMEHVANGAIIHAGTLNANVPCMAAAKAALARLEADDYAVYEQLSRLGGRLKDGLVKLAAACGLPGHAQGPGPMFWFGFTDGHPITDYRSHTEHVDSARYAVFTRRLQDRGVRAIGRGLWYVSAAHTDEDLDRTLDIADKVMRTMTE